MSAKLSWNGNCFSIGEYRFQTIEQLSDLFTLKAENGFVVGKPRIHVEKYAELLTRDRFSNIFEVGILRGGSTVFFGELVRPDRLVAIDLSKKPAAQLEEYIRGSHKTETIRTFYGVDQADRNRLAEIYRTEFHDADLDLVVDDASHYLAESRATFNYLFPKLREGGLYIIEDWSWAHIPVALPVIIERFSGRPPLSNLIIEIILASVSLPEVVADLTINNFCAMVRRGPQRPPADFDISQHGYLMGRPTGKADYFDGSG
jgi:cephalosporin hydroxylase